MPSLEYWTQNTVNKITFVLVDASNNEVTGLGNTFTLTISKNGGAFAAAAGTKAEISDGWYSYTATAGEADTLGPIAIVVTAAGVKQQNLAYYVKASGVAVPGSGSPDIFAEPLPYTCLSLGRYAQILGIVPVFFWQAYTPSLDVFPLPLQSGDKIWYQHAWQSADKVSREDLMWAIFDAEQQIADWLGYWPCPRWIDDEVHSYPRHYNRQAYGNGYNVRGQFKSIPLKYGKLIEAGQRATTLIDTATNGDSTLIYSDDDGDGFYETATVTATTALTDACELKVYQVNKGGDQRWEIRPWRKKTVSGGTITFVFDSWLFINPNLFEAYPAAVTGNSPIDISDVTNYVTEVEVRREYNDTTAISAQFYWERAPYFILGGVCGSCGGVGCGACNLTTQDGCIHIRDVDRGIAVPTPASYSSDSAAWSMSTWSECREPDQVKVWYRAGDQSQEYLRGTVCDPLPHLWARAIAYLATARLERSFCGQSNATRMAEELQIDLSAGQPLSFNVSPDALGNPFGTRRGEVQAWQMLSRFGKQLMRGYAI